MTVMLFIVGTLLLAFISRQSLRHPRSHGFARFFAWECILLLLLHNVPYWFEQRFAWYQLLSWLLLFTSIPMVVCGAVLLRQHGASNPQRDDPTLLAFEKTSQLVTHGIYRYIRHPLYGSLLLLTWGLYLKQPFWWPGLLLAVVATAALQLAASTEEQENLAYFGEAYERYRVGTRRFIPWLW